MAAPSSPAPLSSFETLPIELHREILDHGANPAMVFASRHMYKLLQGSGKVKKQLIRACLLDERVQDYSPNAAHYNLRMLMREPWLTLKWLLEVKAEVLVEKCVEALQDGLPKFPEIPQQAHRSIVEKATNFFQMDTVMRYQASPNTLYWDRSMIIETWDETKVKVRWDGWTYGQVLIERSFWGQKFFKNISFEMPLRNIGVFAAKLLRGPWTQTQGDVLSFFAAYFDRSWSHLTQLFISPKHMKDMQAGMTEALKSRNLCALFLFGGRLKSAFFDEWRGLDRLAPSERSQVSSSHPLFRQIESPAFAPTKDIESQPWNAIRVMAHTQVRCIENIFPDNAWTNEHSRLLLQWLANIESQHIAADMAHAAHPMNHDESLGQSFMRIRQALMWPELKWAVGTEKQPIDDRGIVGGLLKELQQGPKRRQASWNDRLIEKDSREQTQGLKWEAGEPLEIKW